VVIGFCVQLVHGDLGIAFGVLATSSLLAFGVPLAIASAMTHVTEIFTTAASGLSPARCQCSRLPAASAARAADCGSTEARLEFQSTGRLQAMVRVVLIAARLSLWAPHTGRVSVPS